MTLNEYIKQIPDFAKLSRTPTKLVPYLALYLEMEDEDVVIRPGDINRLFEEARVRVPGNTSDVMRKSAAFVRASGGGYRLAHDARERFIATLQGVQAEANSFGTPHIDSVKSGNSTNVASNKNVFVVYGRDQRLRRDLFSFLRSVGVDPLEFEAMAQLTGSTSPTTWEVIKVGFAHAQACIVLFSPDEIVALRDDLKGPDDSDVPEFQPRANVLVEAGMALALNPKRTIIVRVGKTREVSDLDGIQYVNLTGSAESRNKLLGKLRLAGCDVKTHGDDWLNVGNFKVDTTGATK